MALNEKNLLLSKWSDGLYESSQTKPWTAYRQVKQNKRVDRPFILVCINKNKQMHAILSLLMNVVAIASRVQPNIYLGQSEQGGPPLAIAGKILTILPNLKL